MLAAANISVLGLTSVATVRFTKAGGACFKADLAMFFFLI
jgi:hypothetical protein